MQYFLATPAQASALFMRFYGRRSSKDSSLVKEGQEKENVPTLSAEPSPSVNLPALASEFESKIPTHTFSTAELQGYLLLHKKAPEDAVGGVEGWVASELGERLENARKEQERKTRLRQGWSYGAVPTAGPGPGGVYGGGIGVPLQPLQMVSEVGPGTVPEYSNPGPGGSGGVYGGGMGVSLLPSQMVSEVGPGVVPEYSNAGPGPGGLYGGGVEYQGVPLLQPPPRPPMVSGTGPGVVPAYSNLGPGPGRVYGGGVEYQGVPPLQPPPPPPQMVSEVSPGVVPAYGSGEQVQ